MDRPLRDTLVPPPVDIDLPLPESDSTQLAATSTPWERDLFSDDLPIKPEHVERVLRPYSHGTAQSSWGGTCSSAGCARRASELRASTCERCLVKNSGVIDATKTIQVSLRCEQAHRGLCTDRDADIFEEAIGMASAVQYFFSSIYLSQYYRITGA